MPIVAQGSREESAAIQYRAPMKSDIDFSAAL